MYDGNWSNKNIKNQNLWSLHTGYMNICLLANEYLYSKYIYVTEFILSGEVVGQKLILTHIKYKLQYYLQIWSILRTADNEIELSSLNKKRRIDQDISRCKLPRWCGGQESTCQCRRCEFGLLVQKIPWRKKWQHTPVFLPGKSHGQRSLEGYSHGVAKNRTQQK